MKVYELIAELAKLPAGAELEFSATIRASELVFVETSDGEALYQYTSKIDDVDMVHTGLIALHD